MRYFIGIDGGGTKCKCVLTDETFSVIADAEGGPTNFLVAGTEKVCLNLWKVIEKVLTKSGKKLSGIHSIVLGTTGAGRRTDAELLESAFKEFIRTKGNKFKAFFVDSDARIALEGAFPDKPGSILIAGTGSIMFGKDNKGTIHRVGGLGRFIGDEGSGYSLGRRGLNAAAKQYDGRGRATLATKLFAKEFGITDQSDIIKKVYTENFDVASAAPLVISAAEKGDPVCRKIIELETNALIEHLLAMRRMLHVEVLKVSLIGSLLTTKNFYSKIFLEKTVSISDSVQLAEPEYPPQIGAAVIGSSLFS